MTRADWLAIGAIAIAPAMFAYQNGVCRWIRWSGRLADRLLPRDQRQFACFRAIASDAAASVESGEAGGLLTLLRCASAIPHALAYRLWHGTTSALVSILAATAAAMSWPAVRGDNRVVRALLARLTRATASRFLPRRLGGSVLVLAMTAVSLPHALVRTARGIPSRMELAMLEQAPEGDHLAACLYGRARYVIRSRWNAFGRKPTGGTVKPPPGA